MKITQKDIDDNKILVIQIEEEDNTRIEDIREKESFKLLQSKVFKNNILVLEKNYKDEKLDGIYKQYFDDGSLEIEGQYKEDKPAGIFCYYRQDGRLWRRAEVEEDGTINDRYFD